MLLPISLSWACFKSNPRIRESLSWPVSPMQVMFTIVGDASSPGPPFMLTFGGPGVAVSGRGVRILIEPT
jgi:hypothetical protein